MKQLITTFQQKWAEYLLEVIVIIIGIIGAFTLNSWKEYQNKKTQELELLTHLKDDFTANEQLIQQGFENLKTDYQFLKTTIKNTGPNIKLPEKSILDSIESINYTIVELVYGTLNPTLNSSRIELLNDQQLRTQLLAFPILLTKYKQMETAARELALEQRKMHQRHVSILNREQNREKRFLNHVNYFSSNYKAWLSDRNYQNLSLDRLWQIDAALIELNQLKNANKEILNSISRELDRF